MATTPDEASWMATVRDAGRAFAAGEGVVNGKGVAVCEDFLIARFPSPEAATIAANTMMALARLHWLDERAHGPRAIRLK
jgi:hypothetical protein